MSEVATPKPVKKGFNWVFLLVPVAVVAALVLAFALPPSHALIVNGPLKPILARIGMTTPAKPPAPKGDKPPDPAAEIQRLSNELESARKTEAEKDARIAQLQSESRQQASASSSSPPAAMAKPSPTAVPDDIKRAASYWAAMDAEKAADIAQRLPDAYVKGVFGQMPADAVAEIMNAMPAKIAAKLTASSTDQP